MFHRDGLIAEYRLDGNGNDTSGHGYHGIVHGAKPARDRFGNPNGALWFDGVDDYVVVSPPPPLGAMALSVSAWMRYDSRRFRGWNNCIVSQDNGNDDDQSRRVFQLSTLGDRIVWHRMIGARDPMFKRRVRRGEWYHVVGMYTDGVHHLYVDGVRHDSVRHPIWTHSEEPLHIGRKGTPEPYFFFRGAIDDVRIYNRALQPNEIVALFREHGFEKPRLAADASNDPISGQWGENGRWFLDLTLGERGSVTGRIMSGRPDNLAPIASGNFDRATGALVLTGEAKRPDNGIVAPYRIEGMLDEHELNVSYSFDSFEGCLTFTKGGARRWWRLSRFLHRLQRAL